MMINTVDNGQFPGIYILCSEHATSVTLLTSRLRRKIQTERITISDVSDVNERGRNDRALFFYRPRL